jgi:type II secretory pathway component HofQ
VTGQWFSAGPPVSSTNKTDRHNINEILLKVVLSTTKQTNNPFSWLIGLLFMLL